MLLMVYKKRVPISLILFCFLFFIGQSSIRFDYRAAATTAPQLNMNPQNFNSSESRARAVQSHSDEVDQLVQKGKFKINRKTHFTIL